MTVGKITMTSAYTGTVSLNTGKTFTFDIGSFKGGIFSGGSATINCNSSFTIDGTTFTSTSGTMTLAGDVTLKTGSFTHNSGKVVFKRASNTTTIINSSANTSRYIFYDAEFTAPSQTTQFTIKNITLEVDHKLTLSGSNQLFLNTTTSSTIEVPGNILSSNTASVGGGTVTIIVNGTGTQTINDNQGSSISGKLPNIQFNKTGGTVTLMGRIGMGGSSMWEYITGTVNEGTSRVMCYYNNTLKNSSSGTMKFYDLEMFGLGGTHTVSGTVQVADTFVTSQSADCIINGGILKILKDIKWNNTSLTSIGNTTFKFTGTNNQNIYGAVSPQFYKIVVDKNGGQITLQKAVSVSNNLDLVNGYIITDTTNVLTLRSGATATSVSNSSFVKGPVIKIGNTSFTFPVGKGSVYKPIAITAPSLATDAFRAEYFNTQQTLGSAKDSLTYVSACEYWNTKRMIGSSNVKLTLYWDATTCDIYTISTLKIGRWDGAKWHNTGAVTTTGTTTSGSIQNSANQSAFGYFAISKKSPTLYAHAGTDTAFCKGGSKILGASPTGTGGLTPLTYSWSPSIGLSSSTAANPNALPDTTTTYILAVTDLDHSIATDTAIVSIKLTPKAEAGIDRLICNGSTVTIGGGPTATLATAPYSTIWKVGSDTVSFLPNPIVKPSASTNYILTVTNSNGCVAKDTVKVTIDAPIIVNAGRDTTLTIGYNSLTLGGSPTVSGGQAPYTILWSTSETIGIDSVINPVTNYQFSDVYSVLVTDSVGCSALNDRIVTVKPPSINKTSLYGLLSGHTILAVDSTNTAGRAGAKTSISSTVTATNGLYINNTTVDSALTDLDSVIAKFNRLPANLIPNDLSSKTYSPGVYRIDSAAYLHDTLTLNGGNNAYFIFLIRDSFVLNKGAFVNNLSHDPARIFFIVSNKCIVHHWVNFEGNIFSKINIEGDSIYGKTSLMAKNDISLNSALIDFVSRNVNFYPASYVPTKVLSSYVHDLDEDGDTYQDFLGYNTENTKTVHQDASDLIGNGYGGWNDLSLITNLPSLNSRLFRLHNGSGVWDWNKGWYYEPDIYQNQDPLNANNLPINFPENIGCIADDLYKPKGDVISDHFTDIKFSLDGNHADALFFFNMLYSTYDYDKKSLDFADDLKLNLKYVELGNEIYLGGHYKTWCAFPNAQQYVSAANSYIDHLHDDYDDVKVSVVAASPGLEDGDNTEDVGNLDGKICRENTWNAVMNLPAKDISSNSQLHLISGDALSFHHYPASGVLGHAFPLVSDLPDILSYPFEAVNKYFRDNSLKVIPNSVGAWITEYNMSDQLHQVPGSWAHGLFMSAMTLQYLEFAKIKHIYAQTMTLDAHQGAFFVDDHGFDFDGSPIHSSVQLITLPWQLTAVGNGMKLIGEAMRENTQAIKLSFKTSEVIKVGLTDTVLYGWKFNRPNSTYNIEQVIILNLGGTDKSVLLSEFEWATSVGAGYEQISVATGKKSYLNPIAYVIGGNEIAYYTQSGVYKGASTENIDKYPKLLITPPTLSTASVNSQSFVTLPAYSITRIYQIKTNIHLTCESSVVPCSYKLFNGTSGNGAPIQGTSVNLSVTGASKYNWNLSSQQEPSSYKSFLSSYEENNVTFIPQKSGNFTITVSDADNTNNSASCQITVNDPPVITVTPTSLGSYDLSTAQGQQLTASSTNSTLHYWWSPTLGLYNDPIAGSSKIKASTVYARPNQYTDYLSAADNYKKIYTYDYMAYQVTGVDHTTGCFSLGSANVNRINDLAITVNYADGDAFCSSENISLTATSPFGSQTDSYDWYNVSEMPNILLRHANSSLSSYTLTISTTDNNYPSESFTAMVIITKGTKSIKKFTTVNLVPSIIITPPPRLDLCTGESVEIKSSGADEESGSHTYDGSYQWYKNNLSNQISGATESSYTVTPSDDLSNNSSVSYIVQGKTASDFPGCENATNEAIIEFTVNDADPTVGVKYGNITIKEGECATLELTNSSDADFYQWSPGTYLQKLTGALVNTTSLPYRTEPYTFTANGIKTSNNEAGCCSSGDVTVTVEKQTWCDACGTVVDCKSNGSYVVTALEASGYSQQWQKNGIDIPGETNPTYSINYDDVPLGLPVIYQCRYTKSSINCIFFSEPLTLTVVKDNSQCLTNKLQSDTANNSSLIENSLQIAIFPNPTEDDFKLMIYQNSIQKPASNLFIEVLDPFGRILSYSERPFLQNMEAKITLDHNLPEGPYFVKVILGDQVIVKSIFKI